MASEGENPTIASTAAPPAPAAKEDGVDNDSDVELEGMDLEGDDDDDVDADADVDMEPAAAATDSPIEDDKEVNDKLATEDQDELEAAHRERTELMAAERKKVAAPADGDKATMADMLQNL